MVDNLDNLDADWDNMDADWDGDDEDSTDYDSLGVATLGEHNANVAIQEAGILDSQIRLKSASIDTSTDIDDRVV